jgi:glycosyltransferase involved in cell wall biosynthesis
MAEAAAGLPRPRLPSASVCLPTFNGESYLLEQLESIAGQEVLPEEIVIGDDASTDRTIEVVERFAESAPMRVVVLRHEERLGLPANLRAIGRRASADVVFFSDQDDVWKPTKIGRMLQAFGEGVDAVASDSRPFDSVTGSPAAASLWQRFGRGAPPSPSLGEVVARRVFLPGHNFAVRRAALLEHLWPEAEVWADFFCALVFAALGSLALVDEVLVLYRQHEHNTIGVRGRRSREDNVADWTRSADTLAAVRSHLEHLGRLRPGDAELLGEREGFLRARVEYLDRPFRHVATPLRLALSRQGYTAYANGFRSFASDLATLVGRR